MNTLLDTKAQEIEAKRLKWNKHIESWGKSDQSQAAYCNTHGIDLNQFCYYRKKFRTIEPKQRKLALVKMRSSVGLEPLLSSECFIVKHPSGTLMVPQRFEPKGLKLLLDVLEGESC